MTWTAMTTLTAGTVVGATVWNGYVKQNIEHLFAPPFGQVVTADGSTVSTTATTAVPITADFDITLGISGGRAEVYFNGDFSAPGAWLGFSYNGTAWNGGNIINLTALAQKQSFHVWATGLPTGNVTFTPIWYVSTPGETARLRYQVQSAIFWVRGH